MKILVLLAHPSEGSLNSAIARRAVASLERIGHDVVFHDLYREDFSPLMTEEELAENYTPSGLVGRHCDELKSADGIVVVHPNWRHQAPAVLKGWVDRVIRSGVAFEYAGEDGGEGRLVPLLTGKSVTVFNTADCPEEELTALGDPLKQFWGQIVFGNCGVDQFVKKDFCSVFLSTLDQREAWLEEVETLLKEQFKVESSIFI